MSWQCAKIGSCFRGGGSYFLSLSYTQKDKGLGTNVHE